MDDVGFAAVADYNSPRSPKINDIFPAAQTIIVMAIREMSHCESSSPRLAMNGRLDVMEFARNCNYQLARFIEKNFKARAMSIPLSYPMDMNPLTTGGVIGEVSLRHAAVAAGLGAFGRNNLVVHPRLGARVLFCGVLTDLILPSDPPVAENPCTECNICIESCPAHALDKEGYTDVGKCLAVSQPYGLGKAIEFWTKFAGSSPDEQKKMFFSPDFWQMYQAQFIGFQYFCFQCFSSCPLGEV
jgi:epoxyqueuosine reductase QueG